MKLKSIEFHNFRLFEKRTFDLLPLTLLTGPNSSGKSSVVKGLMLLQENMKFPNFLGHLTFETGNHQLGSFDSIKCNTSESDTIQFNLVYEKESNKKSKESKSIFDDINDYKISYEYVKDTMQKEKGILASYVISIRKEDEFVPILSMLKKESGYLWWIDHAWFIDNILGKKMLSFKPALYLLWDELSSDDLDVEVRRRKEIINKEYEEKKNEFLISFYRRDDIKKHFLTLEQIEEKRKKLLEGSEPFFTKGQVVNKEEDDRIEVLRKLIKNKNKEYNALVASKDNTNKKKLIDLEIEIESLEADIEYLEGEKDKLDRIDYETDLSHYDKRKKEKINLLNKQEENEKQKIEKIKEKEEKILEEEKKEKLEQVREGRIRTLLFKRVEEAVKKRISEAKKENCGLEVKNLKGRTIIDFLLRQEWGGEIDSLFRGGRNLEEQELHNYISWDENTFFIRNKLIELKNKKGKKIYLDDILDEVEDGQLSKVLIEQVDSLLNLFTKPLPFTPISATRGVQQRLYRSSNNDFHLEEALSILLSMQYREEKEKLDFIQHWATKFYIKKEDEILEARVVDGDYVRGVIVSEDKKIINIADKGLGIAQLIPIIIYTAKAIGTNQLLCVEEPGTHLHPDLQSKLVDFVEDAIKKKVFFLFETHSEYFIRKLQYKVCHESNGFKTSDILIHYLSSRDEQENKKITIDSNGYLKNEEGEIVHDLGKEFLDAGAIWVNKRFIETKIKEGNTIVYCEGSDEEKYKNMKLENTLFIGRNGERTLNSKGVFITAQKDSSVIGLRDRDYLTDSECECFMEEYKNYKILSYYSCESYMYHPENVKQAILNKYNSLRDFCMNKYKKEIMQIKNANLKEITYGVGKARTTYEELKISKNKHKKEIESGMEIIECLESNDFDDFYKFFNMKKEKGNKKGFTHKFLEKYNLTEQDYTSTEWFKEQISSIIKS